MAVRLDNLPNGHCIDPEFKRLNALFSMVVLKI